MKKYTFEHVPGYNCTIVIEAYSYEWAKEILFNTVKNVNDFKFIQ